MKKIIWIVLLLPFIVFAQTATQNYIQYTTYKSAINNLDYANVPVTAFEKSTHYFDGLGRPIQVNLNMKSGSGKNLITHIEYDGYGRQSMEYLPYMSNSTGHDFDTNAKNNTLNYAQYSGQKPYSQKMFEPSPLNTVSKQGAPGNAWSIGSGKEIKYEYKSNTGTEVKMIKASASWNGSVFAISLSHDGSTNYPANELYKTVIKNENWTTGTDNTSEEFKNKAGQVVLKRTYGTSIVNGAPVNGAHDTYYVYDQYGNLTYVLPPLANGSTSPTVLNNICYQYVYDQRNRLIEKKLPGKVWEYIVYDKLNRIIATGGAYAPFGASTGSNTGWNVTKYDIFNRPVYTAWFNNIPANSSGRQAFQNELNNATAMSEKRVASIMINNIPILYTNDAYPKTGLTILTINYYDDYTFMTPAPSVTPVEQQTVIAKPKGLLTGTWTRVLSSETEFLGDLSYMLYDKKGRIVRNYKKNYLQGMTQMDTKLDFIGKTLYTITSHKRDNNAVLTTVRDDFSYSDQDRLISQSHSINNAPSKLLKENSYDELGQLIVKKVGGTSLLPLQTVNYSYNIRGWLTGINNDPTNKLILNTSEKDLFAFKINYNTVENVPGFTGKPLFNGNISETYWRSLPDNVMRKYVYSYDGLNRLESAIYQKHEMEQVTNAYNESVSYDKNGNIKSMRRNGDFDHPSQPILMDDLQYNYAPENNNLLTNIVENAGAYSTLGFKKTNTTGLPDFEYDNGNMTVDRNKGISQITYNHLNLPVEIIYTTSPVKKIHYFYDALGNKVQKTIKNLSSIAITDYLDGFQYKNSEMLFFPTSEGYVNVNSGVFKDVFNYTDHLGNVTLSYTEDPNTSGATVTLEQNSYYPFGLKHTNYNVTVLKLRGVNPEVGPNPFKYKYNGKELQDELGLNMYDFGARNYDPAIGRWMNIDPKAESYLSYSPYNYVLNNPMFFVDPNGEDVYLFYYLRGNNHGGKEDKESDSMFWAAAMTRATDFLNSEGGEGDTYVFRGIDSMDDIKGAVEGDVAANKDKFGKTAEFGLWSHGGADGPFRENKNGSFDQLSVKDWGKIDFNWSSDAKAGFYGCRTAMPETAKDGKSFSALLSGQKNMNNVEVAGQTHRSWPSPFTNVRQPTDNIADGKHIYPTYMVGSDKSFPQRVNTMLGSPTYAQPMAVYQNGVLIRFEHQSGKKK